MKSWGSVTLLLLLMPAHVMAQDVDLDALERKLKAEQAKEEQARQTDAARRAAEARQVRLLIRSDAPCRLTVNGVEHGTLDAGVVVTRVVPPGEQLVECVATEEASAKRSEVIALEPGTQRVMELALAAQVQGARNAREAEAEAAVRAAEAARRAEAEAAERAREVAEWTSKALNPPMVVIPAGSFEMGSPRSEKDRHDTEGPQRRVAVASFEMAKHEVTFAEWDACVADGGCSHTPGDQGWGRGSRPVINVSWEDAQGYIRWLNGKTGRQYRLPSEAEWEYAARAGTTTPWSTGSSISQSQAQVSAQQTVPVGSFAANPWGLHDMHGNVLEWTQDCWNASYRGGPTGGSAWESGDCSRRVLRGGAGFNSPARMRSATRDWSARASRFSSVGFRLARTL